MYQISIESEVDLTAFNSVGNGIQSSQKRNINCMCVCERKKRESIDSVLSACVKNRERKCVFSFMAFYVSFVVPSQCSASINFHLTRKTFPSSVKQCSVARERIKATRKYADDKNKATEMKRKHAFVRELSFFCLSFSFFDVTERERRSAHAKHTRTHTPPTKITSWMSLLFGILCRW